MLRSLVTAVRTLTAIPVPGREAERFADALPWFPVVGAALGLASAGSAWGLQRLGVASWPEGIAFVLLALSVLATRGLHLDGVADWADGFWGGSTRERVLEIMKDPNVGAFGAIALVLALLGKWVGFCVLLEGAYASALILTFALSRWVQVELAVWLPYARQEGGTGQRFVAEAARRHRLTALALAGVIAVATAGPAIGLGALAVAFALGRAFGGWCRSRVGGITGDLLGAANELVETTLLLLLAGLIRSGGWSG